MKYQVSLFITLLVLAYSCDVVTKVTIHNYQKASEVYVVYENYPSVLQNSDTLTTSSLGADKEDGMIIRKNTSDTSYNFIAPSYTAIMLNPLSLGQSITKVTINRSRDSVLNYHLNMNKKEKQRLEKLGIVKTKKFLFYTTEVIISNK